MESKTNQTTLQPIAKQSRIVSLDVLRGISLLGILLMNINGFGLFWGYNDPTKLGGDTGLNLYTWMATNLLFEGTMRALFSLLFGVGMYIFLDRLVQKDAGIKAADIYFRRITWLLVFGLIHKYLLLWVGEILFDYALMGFLVYSFRLVAPKKLIVATLVLFCIGTGWNYYDYQKELEVLGKVKQVEVALAAGEAVPKDLQEAKDAWERKEAETSPEAMAKTVEEMQKGYFTVMSFIAPINFTFSTENPFRSDVWDVLSMMLFGIALFRLGFLTGEKPAKVYLLMIVIGYPIGLAINYYEIQMIMDAQFSHLSFTQSSFTYYWGRFFVAIGHIGLIMLFCKYPILNWLKISLAAVGKMALTNYIMHSVICMFFFTGVGFGMIGELERFELLYVVFSIWLFQMILSPIWLKYFQFGPLEWLWRNLSYQKIHPFKK